MALAWTFCFFPDMLDHILTKPVGLDYLQKGNKDISAQ
jgi:hypothetical protein